MSSAPAEIAIAYGDGIGPEIMSAVVDMMKAAGAALTMHEVKIGEAVYRQGIKTGIEDATWDIIRQCSAFLKAPITTPQGGGFASLNVAVRTTLGLYANVRPCVAYHPFVQTLHPKMDVVIVRENEEDLYCGIEYRQTDTVCSSLKINSRLGSEKIIRYAFEYAKSHERKKVSCFTKDNILKLSDGLFHSIFEEVGKEYPDLEKEHWIVDIGAAKLADTPDAFDVVVLPNLYGDILSDVAAQIAGSVGLAGSANIGDHGAMFEAIHGSAPRRAGQDVANPSGLLLAAIQMLVHIGQPDVAARLHNAWLCTLEEGIHTYDIYTEGKSKEKVGTSRFSEAVIEHLGRVPQTLAAAHYRNSSIVKALKKEPVRQVAAAKRVLVGADIFCHWTLSAEKLAKLAADRRGLLELTKISNRGAQVWPKAHPETRCIDQYRCRFLVREGEEVSHKEILAMMQHLMQEEVEILKMETLYTYGGEPGYGK